MIQWKLVDEISENFPELFITRKYVKIRCKNRGSPCYFLSSRSQKIKNITKIEQKRLFLLTFLVSFFIGVSRSKTELHNKYMINFVSDSFFEQDHLLNLITLIRVSGKRWPKCARNWCSAKSDWQFLFLLWLSDDLYMERILSETNMGYGVNFWKSTSFVCTT